MTIMSAMAEMERGMISLRQKDVHQDRRENKKVWGVDLGPLPLVDKLVSDRISSDRDLGLSYKSIAERLNSDGVKTVLGGVKWYPSTVRHIYLRK